MRRWRLPFKTLATFTFVILVVVGWLNADAIEDWYKLRGYTPSASVVSLASQSAMSDYGRHIFYINRPQLVSDINTFHSRCVDSEQTIVLGCYHQGENGIDVYNVQDSRLAGIQQVTAAHEMLHGVYERLSSKDRQSINKLLQDYYDNQLKDQRVIDTIEIYKKTEPNDLLNEMHSIFATEIASLPAPLEAYYKKYFTNRTTVTNLAQSYQAEFANRINQISDYDKRLAELKIQISAQEVALADQLNQINASRDQLDRLRESDQISEYNAAVPGFNRSVNSYNSGVKKLKTDITSYNDLIATRNTVTGELKTLSSAIDTRLSAQSGQ